MKDISADLLVPYLRTRMLGRNLLAADEMESTNLTAAELASKGCAEGMVVVADHQTGGRGRNGRTWFSPAGRNLYFTMVLRPDCQPGLVPQLAIVAAMSMRRGLKCLCPDIPVSLKWPNDIWVKGLKLCGILCSMSCMGMKTEYAVVGIGVNVNLRKEDLPGGIQGSATSLGILSGSLWNRSQVLATILNAFEEDYDTWLAHGSLAPFMEGWNEASLLNGRQVSVGQGNVVYSGIVKGITEDGRLILVRGDGGTDLISAGDAHILSGLK